MPSHIAVLTDLHNALVNRTSTPPAELVEHVGTKIVDPTFNNDWICNIARHRPLAGALLFSRIADQLNGQARIEALAIAASSSSSGGNPAIAATLIAAADVTARRTANVAYPRELTALKFDHEIRSYLGLPTPHTNQSA